MKKTIVVLSLLFIFVFTVNAVAGETHVVYKGDTPCTTGDYYYNEDTECMHDYDEYTGPEQPIACGPIQAAVDAAAPPSDAACRPEKDGETIIICPGTYVYEYFVISIDKQGNRKFRY